MHAQTGYQQLLFELSGGYRMPQYVLLVLLFIRAAQQLSVGFLLAAATSNSRWVGDIAFYTSFLSFSRADSLHGGQLYLVAMCTALVWMAALLGGCLVQYLRITR